MKILAVQIPASVLLSTALGQPVHVEADIRFMQGMTYHHAQALEMAELFSSRTESEGMRLLAQRIGISQTDEIVMMARWLEARGEGPGGIDTLRPCEARN